MLNSATNFLFYTVCSKTSRNELYLIIYYYGYWIWSENYRKFPICNHPSHNKHININDSTMPRLINDSEPNSNVIKMKHSKNSKLKIHCFLLNAKRLRTLCAYESMKNKQEKSISNKKQAKSENQNVYLKDEVITNRSKSIELNNLIDKNNNETFLEKES